MLWHARDSRSLKALTKYVAPNHLILKNWISTLIIAYTPTVFKSPKLGLASIQIYVLGNKYNTIYIGYRLTLLCFFLTSGHFPTARQHVRIRIISKPNNKEQARPLHLTQLLSDHSVTTISSK